MITLLDKNILYNTFEVNDFNSLENKIDIMAPSLVEYYLSTLYFDENEIYLNKQNIERTLYLGEYSIYFDYDNEIFLEINKKKLDTCSLW